MFLIGPGVGESILVQVPPGEWMIVDGCMVGRRSAPVVLLQRYGVRRVAAMALTHPHEDHARGLLELLGSDIEVDRVGCVDCWSEEPGLDEIWREPPPAALAADDPELRSRRAAARHLLTAIRGRWHRRPESKWALRLGERLSLGNGSVTVLSPNDREIAAARAARAAGGRFSANRLCSAMAVEVGNTRVTLGSDLPYREKRQVLVGGGWKQVPSGGDWPRLPDADALKVPHHGSSDALASRLLGPRKKPQPMAMTVAPFSSQGLPDPRDDHGLAMLLKAGPEVDVTALDTSVARRVTRAELDRRMRASVPGAPKQIRWAPYPRADVPEDVCVTLVIDEQGNVLERWHGRLAGLVVS
jgi:hypothetical protein